MLIPFKYLDSYIYNLLEKKTIRGKSNYSRQNKCQVTLILYIQGDSELRIKLKLIFYSSLGLWSKILKNKQDKYSPNVTVKVNKTTYNNKELFKEFIKKELIPMFDGNEGLLVIDVATFYYTQTILNLLYSLNIITALILPSYTSFLQPLNTTINKVFK